MNTIKIIQHNVLKWTYSRANELSNYYASISPDVILINATGVRDDTNMKIYTYKVYQRNARNEDHAGVAIAIKNNIQHKIISNFNEDFLAVQIQTEIGPVILATAYLPPRRDYMPMQDLMGLLNRNIPVYIMGDLNINHPFCGYTYTNNKGRATNRLINNNMIRYLGPNFKTLTNRRGAPDIVLTNRAATLNIDITEGNITTSDHIPLIITIASVPIKIGTERRSHLKRANWDAYRLSIAEEMERIQQVDGIQQGQINEERINNRMERWEDAITTASRETIPQRTIQFNFHPKSSDYLNLLRIAYQQISAEILRNGLTPGTQAMVINIQNEIKQEYDRLQAESWNKLIESINNIERDDPKFWLHINRLRGSNKGVVPYLLDDHNQKITGAPEMLNLLRSKWQDVFRISPEEDIQFDQNNITEVDNFVAANRHRTLPFDAADLGRLDENCEFKKPITTARIKNIIRQFKQKAPGPSGITKQHLAKLPDVALDHYRDTLNLTLSRGAFPALTKKGITAMIPKSEKVVQPLQFRPITLLEVHGKIFERIINDRLVKFLERENILPFSQHGFRGGRGTQTAIIAAYEKIAINQKEKKQVNLICRDVKKAFDKVWHNGLKAKILRLNLPDCFERILCNYLDDRSTRIKFNNLFSDPINLLSGVPQGSILAPTLFIFYTSDIPEPGPNCDDILYADDVSQLIQYHHRSKLMMARRTEREVERLNEYEAKWKIQTNMGKFKILSISKSGPSPITVNNRVQPFVRSLQMLGLTFSRTGCKLHVRQRLQMAVRERGKLNRFRNLKTKLQIKLYKSLVRAKLEYPIVPICLAAKSTVAKLQQFQNKSLKICCRGNLEDQGLTIEEIHLKYNVEPINIRLYRLAQKAWDKAEMLMPDLAEETRALNNLDSPDHYWWKRIGAYIAQDEPQPIYVTRAANAAQ